MRLDLAVYSGLLAVGLGAAYWASLPAKDSDSEKVKVFAIDPKALTEIRYTSPEAEVVATRRSADAKFWITFTRRTADPKPEAPASEPVTERFLSNDKFKEILDAFNPFEAQRVIGVVDEKSLEEFGLKDTRETFKVTGGDASTVFELKVGKVSYGSRNRFVQDTRDGRVLLVGGDAVADFSKANVRLYERNIMGTSLDEATKAEAKAGAKSKRFDHSKRDASGNLQWSDDAEGATANASYKTWFEKIDRLKLVSFATDAQVATLESAQPFLEVTFFKDSKPVETIALLKTREKSNEAGKEGEVDAYWIRSSFLGTVGRLTENRASPIEKDIASILGG